MKRDVTAAAIQMISGPSVKANLAKAEQLIAQAASAGADLVVLPENFALFDSQRLLSLAQSEATHHQVYDWLSEQAATHNVCLVGGSTPVLSSDPQRVLSRQWVFSAAGELLQHYDKRHLFDANIDDAQSGYRESDFIAPGDDVAVAKDVACIGLSICYDVRFSEHYHRLRRAGAEVLVVPSAFTQVTTRAHWEVLLRARAVETQCFVIGANQGGQHSETRITGGHSMIVDPWGEVLACCSEQGEEVVVARLSAQRLTEVRERMPVLAHRRDAFI